MVLNLILRSPALSKLVRNSLKRKLIVGLEDQGRRLVPETFCSEPWRLVPSSLANSWRRRWVYRLSIFEWTWKERWTFGARWEFQRTCLLVFRTFMPGSISAHQRRHRNNWPR